MTLVHHDAPHAELRQLTVLFCDLLDSTALSDTHDPEDWREIVASYHSLCSEVIQRHDGHIAQYLGDGVLVYYGYPNAHEDDARRAVTSALGIVHGLKGLNARLERERGITLSVRIGIHTGPVVVGDVGGRDRREQLALGRTPNLAARIQNLAGPGEVIVSDDTARMTRGFFDFVDLGAHTVKGISDAVVLQRVLRETGATSRMDVAYRAGLTQLTGRTAEVERLEDIWRSVGENGAQTVLVCGEPGIGKSRLAITARARAVQEGATVLESFCSPYYQNSPLYPLLGTVERALGFARDTTEADKRAALEARLQRRGILNDEAFAVMAQFLSIDHKPLALTPQQLREATLETLREWLFAVAADGPTLLIVEDLHWADPTTLEFIGSVIAARAALPMMSLLTFRPEFAPKWKANGRVSSLTLNRLDQHDATAMVSHVAEGKRLPPEVLNQILARTEGVPLFVEEVTKAVLEMGVMVDRGDRYELAGPFPKDFIPPTVQETLIARLERVGSAKATAQVAATIGREFRFDVLRAVSPIDESTLREDLNRLLNAELIYHLGTTGDEIYIFKHALIQDAAYQSLLKKTRRELHASIATALDEKFSDLSSEHPELVAEHLTRAGHAAPAVAKWLVAGQKAMARAAAHEAIAHLERGLALLPELPEAGRLERELELQVAIIPPLIQTQGWASHQLGRTYERTEVLLDLLPETPYLLGVLGGLFAFHLVAGRPLKAHEIANRVYPIAVALGDPGVLQAAYTYLAASNMYLGRLTTAVEHGRAGIALFDFDREQTKVRVWGQSEVVCMYCFLSEMLCMLGYQDQATELSDYAVELARRLDHVAPLAFVTGFRPGLFTLLQDRDRAAAAADESLRFEKEQRLAFWQPIVTIYKGWTVATEPQVVDAVSTTRQALAAYRAAGNGAGLSRLACALAEVLWKAGAPAEAFATLSEAMAVATANSEAFFEPELYRLQGEFLGEDAANLPAEGRSAALDAGRASLLRSIALARGQKARTLELRAATSLYALERRRGDAVAERARLAELYAWFTEGFQTPTLRAAKRMLDSPSAT